MSEEESSSPLWTKVKGRASRVGYCWWGCCVFTVLAVVVLSSLPMLVGSALMWSKLTPQFFAIARSYDDVICFRCIIVFTISIAILLIVGMVMAFVVPAFCVFGERRSHSGAAFAFFCVILLAAGIVLIICEPIWFASNMNIVKNYEESSKFTFKQQLDSRTIQITWDEYQEKFECCGYHGYKDYERLYRSHSVPLACCNTTTLPSVFDCVVSVKHVTEKEINVFQIYTEGCPKKIVHFLNLDSASVLHIGIACAVFSGFFFVIPIVMILLTFLLTAKNEEDVEIIGLGMLMAVISIVAVCLVAAKNN